MDHIDIIPQKDPVNTTVPYPIRFSLHYDASVPAFEMHSVWSNGNVTIKFSSHASALCKSMCKGYYFPIELIFHQAKVNKKATRQ